MVAAAIDLLRESDLSDLTLEAVARTAGVSRQTLYRHFGSRDGLIEAVVLHEEEALTRAAIAAVEHAATLEEAIRLAITSLLEGARAHPLIDRLLISDPGEVLSLLALGEGPVMSTAGPIVRNLLAQFVPDLGPSRSAALGEMLSRLVVSYTIAPAGQSPIEAADMIADLVMGRLADPASAARRT